MSKEGRFVLKCAAVGLALGLGIPFAVGLVAATTGDPAIDGLLLNAAQADGPRPQYACEELALRGGPRGLRTASLADIKRCLFSP